MTLSSLLLLAVIGIAFPREGMKLPAITNTYVIGWTDGGETNLVIGGQNVSVYPSGAWAMVIPVKAGSNLVDVGVARRSFDVAQPAKPSKKSEAKPPKKYEKLPYASDIAKASPCGREPSEITIVIDPGHGGSDTGAVSPHGKTEKEANLLLSLEIRRELVSLGYKVVMTREDDSFPALYDRPKVAHAANADAFVSIHHNAPPFDRNPLNLRYHAVYCWNDLGEKLAKAVNTKMGIAFGDTLKNNGVMRANYAVTRNPEIPSCLVEVDFVTSPEGEEAIWNAERRVATAKAIAAGIADWTKLP